MVAKAARTALPPRIHLLGTWVNKGKKKGRSVDAPAPSHKPFGYESRSLRLPFFSLILPFLWSERPSLFLLLSPVRAPPASFIRPLALSIFPSFLSSLLLLLGTPSAPSLN